MVECPVESGVLPEVPLIVIVPGVVSGSIVVVVTKVCVTGGLGTSTIVDTNVIICWAFRTLLLGQQ